MRNRSEHFVEKQLIFLFLKSFCKRSSNYNTYRESNSEQKLKSSLTKNGSEKNQTSVISGFAAIIAQEKQY
jgi:hypothetical protein